ncbi:MAG: amidinotransferase, partial [Candidatus Thorarchaeota archaeon]
MEPRIESEWDQLRTVAIHRPGMEMFFGLLEPYASLYERAFSRNGAIREHERLEHVLKHEFHVNVIRLREKLLEAAERNSEVHDKLVDAAYDIIDVTGSESEVKLAR